MRAPAPRLTRWTRALGFAWLGIVRQPLRSWLAILGIAAVGALLFDMLLLSRGLVLSFRALLDRAGYDVRVLASELPPLLGPDIADARAVSQSVASLPAVSEVLQLQLRNAETVAAMPAAVEFVGADVSGAPLWTLLEGHELDRAADPAATLIVNRNVSRTMEVAPGSRLALRGRCSGAATLPPAVFTVAGVAEFPFDDATALTVGGTLEGVGRLCPGASGDRADLLLVRSAPGAGADRAAAAIRDVHPGLHIVTNEQLIERFSRVEFSYFRQISFVLTVVTLFFGFLLIAVLLTVSVNQRLGEIAALRAIGLSRERLAAGIVVESALLVGAGGLLALPLGLLLTIWLETILHRMPGIPVGVDFFVFEPRALLLHGGLLAAAALGAAAYPVRMVSALPIAATLRREVVS